VTGGASASTVQFLDSALTTVNVSGTQALALSGLTSVTAINVSGGAGLTTTLGSGTAFTSTSTGTDVVTISALASKAIVGNGTAAEEIVWNGGQTTTTGSGTTTVSVLSNGTTGSVTGFHELGIGSSAVGENFYLGGTSSVFTSVDVQANNTSVTIYGANVGTKLYIDGAETGTVSYFTADTAGTTDSLALTLGTTTTKAATVITGLTLGDANQSLDGIGNVTATINDSGAGAAGVFSITNLSDTSLTNLTVAGTGGLTIGNQFTDSATALTINGTSTNTTGITFTNGITDTSLTTLTLTGTDNISFGTGVIEGGKGLVVNGSADNANVNLTLTGLTSGASVYTDSITLGNGADTVIDTGAASATATNSVVNIKLGTGADTVTLGAYSTNNVTFGAHSAAVSDTVNVAAVSIAATTIAPTAIITGTNDVGADKIGFLGDAGATGTLTALTATQITTALNGTSATLGNVVNAVLSNTGTGLALGQHGVAEFVFQGNTYVLEQGAATGTAWNAAGGNATLVELVGTHTLTSASTAAAGSLTLHG
jgi:S-layer protein